MQTIAILSTKGGVGKTTLSTNLAVAMGKQRGKLALLVDIDPQASSLDWADSREADDLTVISTPVKRLQKIIDAAKSDGVTHLLIDCPPHGDPNVAIAARAADLILVPCRPAGADIQAMSGTCEIINFVGTPALIVLNAVPSRGTLADEAREALAPTNIEIWKGQIGNRTDFVRSYNCGLGITEYAPKSKAATEIRSLLRKLNGN